MRERIAVAVLAVAVSLVLSGSLFAGWSDWYVVRVSTGKAIAGPFTFKSDCDDTARYFEKQTGWMHQCRILG